MALQFFLRGSKHEAVTIPDHHAHIANDLALRAFDVSQSFEAYLRKVREEHDHPTQEKLREATNNRSILAYLLVTILYIFVLLWEWEISREIYVALFNTEPVIPFAVLSGLSFLASFCLAESTSLFSLLSAGTMEREENPSWVAISGVYDRGNPLRKLTPQSLFRTTGIFLTVLVVLAVYTMSHQRIEWLTQTGEMPRTSLLQLFLPVILFGMEVLLGIPTFFMCIWAYDWHRTRKIHKTLTKLRDKSLILSQAAVQMYSTYLDQYAQYTQWARQSRHSEPLLIPANTVLQQALRGEICGDSRSSTLPAILSSPQAGSGLSPVSTQDQTTKASQPPDVQPQSQDDRIEDLLTLVDEQIHKQNLSL